MVDFQRQLTFKITNVRPRVRSGVRPGVRSDVRPDVWAARVSSAAPKKKSFDRGGPVWPPRSNVVNHRLGGGLGGLCPPSQISGGAPQPKPKNFEKQFKKVFREKVLVV